MRKSFFIISLIALTISFTGCLNVPEPQYSPEISGSYFYVNPRFTGDSLVGAKDTLEYLFYDADEATYNIDTVYMGDTVMFAAYFYTFTSDLVSVKVDWEKNHLNLWYQLTDSTKNAMTSESDTINGKFVFDLGYNGVSFPLFFTPVVKGGTNLKLTVTSNSEFPTSSVKFNIPVQEQVADSTATN